MTDLAGKTLGKYQVIERLGRGGMADVYKAYQPGLERYVAIKVMHSHLSEDGDFITRFQREAKAVAGLRHPNIVQVFDFDTQGDNHYMVMEYVEGGQSLKEVLAGLSMRGQRLPLGITLSIVEKLADALDYAHSRDMIHRDIKPANVLMPTMNNPLLSDFGIARLLDQSGLTASGAMIGTPAYMSPEQGRGEQADTRSDIYALGIMLYEMLVGQPPYDADTPYGVILKHINDPLISPRMLDASVPEAVEQIVLKALAKDPYERYDAAGRMRDALARAQQDLEDSTQPSQATPVPAAAYADTLPMAGPEDTLEVAKTPAATQAARRASPTGAAPARKSRWWMWVLAGAVGLAIIAGGALAISGALGGDGTADVPSPAGGGSEAAGAPEEEPEGGQPEPSEPDEYDALAQEGWEHIYVGDGDLAMPIFLNILRDRELNAKALAGQGIVQIWRGADAAAVASIRAAVRSDESSPYAQFANGALHHWGSLYSPEIALEAYNRAFETCGDDQTLCWWTLHERAQLHFWDLDQREAGLEDIRMATELANDPYRRADTMVYLAQMLEAEGNIDDALITYEDGYSSVPPGDMLWMLEEGAISALNWDRYDVADRFYQRALEDTNGEPRYLVGRSYVALKLGDIDRALELANQAHAFDPDLLPAFYVKGLIGIEAGRYDEALEQFQRVVEREGEWYDNWNWWLFRTDIGLELYYDMARATYLKGDLDGARELVQRSLEYDPNWPEPHLLLGDINRDSGDLGAARDEYLMAIDQAYDDPEMQAEGERRIAELTQ